MYVLYMHDSVYAYLHMAAPHYDIWTQALMDPSPYGHTLTWTQAHMDPCGSVKYGHKPGVYGPKPLFVSSARPRRAAP